MDADELQAELNKLWSRVTTDDRDDPRFPDLPAAPSTDSPVRDASIEAMMLLRRQRESETAELRHLLAVKERTVAELTDQLRSANAELVRLRQGQVQRERRIMGEVVGVSAKLEQAQAMLRDQEERSSKEERVLRDLAEKTRQQLAAETARWRELERQWGEREQQYLLDLKEAQALLMRAEQGAGKSDSAARKLVDDLKTAKGAVEATLAELLTERKTREASEQERDRALKKVAEVEEHFQELQKIWQEERKQWQELWDRERSGWESRQRELSGWEERLRKEREAWHADLRTKEEAELRFAEQMAKNLRESSEATSKLSGAIEAMRRAAAGGPEGAGLRRALGLVVLAALALGIGYPLWRHLTRPRLEPLASERVSFENPTALAYDGNLLWVAEWSGRLVGADAARPSRIVSMAQVSGLGPYHPAALAASGDTLWSVDSAQARILKHSAQDPSVPRDSWASPGPAPLAVAHDGSRLWSYDAVNRMLYRHDGEGPHAPAKGISVDVDVVPVSMHWVAGDLWMHDSKGRRLLRLKVEDSGARIAGSIPLGPAVVSMTLREGPQGRFVWSLLSDSRGGYTIQRLELKGR